MHFCAFKIFLGKKNKHTWNYRGNLKYNTTHIRQKSSVTLIVVGWNDSNAIYIAFSESCEPKRFIQCWKKVEKKKNIGFWIHLCINYFCKTIPYLFTKID